ncbi:hypothetical protein Dsin_007066 [Dipteronia sinensis]|uniref:Protein kinase domain-containing protein n=1 Tax=Dipteronia sinensis TaxID=43782 RepID=A0AAE0B0X8_9ROSI|nr:hypothetical protein Dsin_007066 [Dipteronia sinensis]
MVIKFFLLASLLWGGAFFTQVSCFDFNFPSFPNDNNLLLSNNSNVFVQDAIQVTPDVRGSITNKSGRAFYRKPFRLWKKRGINAVFNSTFTLSIRNQTATAGEGLAFVLTDNTDVPENSDGQWLSIVNATTNGTSQANIVAIEFDTRKSYSQDLDDNHVGLDINSIYSFEQISLNSYGVYLSTGTNVTVQVQYDGKNITVFVGHNAENLDLVLSKLINLSEYLPQKVFVGFTASTSNYTQLNCVKSWKFNGTNFDEGLKFWVWIVVAAAVVVVLLSSGVAFYFYRKKRNESEDVEDTYPSIEDQIQSSTQAPRKFKLRKLIKATDKFNPKNQLGRGGFGTVYKGTWKNKLIAVKRVSETSRQGKQAFIAEVTTIGSLRHRNLVKLIGWCYENNDFLLVYEYMPNGSLDKFIFYNEKSGTGQSTLDWETRVSIIHGTALALDYLHNGCEKRVLHRDIKSSNIMLDSEFKARLGDFGLARTIQESQKTYHSTKEIAGTPGYMAPEIFLTGRATIKTDIYAFGVLILEVACGRKPGSQSEQNDYNTSIVHWIWELYGKDRIIDAADSRLEVKFSEEEMGCVLILGLACCHPNPHLRPSMKVVLQVLSGEAPPPQVPIERPSFVWPAMPPSFNGSGHSLTGSQLTPFSDISAR